ncbi:uncharacterized protein LOC110092032 isoform X1 [Dendrobium catenatum]|uniref:uncharacterized protein LOC110092032 isoform X1 n=1 Tax=Dendrobium catenatum TaxID=906689 RepID=UPI0009F3E012|nr:uncharacterized protein LOC110092032 isoform X1 [Dendrobium catenatum]XP_020672023.1 uncharacterized protein LOC110092032 isoform X1 [Dendrobium catenatum]XP_020672024.1 uncharacterized protein LOC110092032 isoform X1 [Dendrobium catenatum]XP_028549519.1 uncharacterized protein LOC110092032 isoform X1 [Dendrobium catenatum]XP_028549523.1 uncharacterized protein LOC110092032 isoform X1 [Dendrobium catenatum]
MEDGDSKAILELIIDPQNSKVICASAQKEFIDFIFSLLKLPLGTVIKLFSPQSKIGSLGKLYQSVKNLDQVNFVTNRAKSSLLSPNVFISDLATPLLLGTTAIKEPTYYLCNSCKSKITIVRNILCPICKLEMTEKVDFVVPSASYSSGSTRTEDGGESTKGFVREGYYFTITDDLIVTPPCDISIRKIFENYGIVDGIELKKVVVGIKEGLAILEASLESSTVLTDVFCSTPTKKRKRIMISQ